MSSLLTKRQSCPTGSEVQPMHFPFSTSVSGSESIVSEEFTAGTTLQRDVNTDDDVKSYDPLLQSQALSYRNYINLIARSLRDVPFIRNLPISPELFTSFFENCIANGDILSAKM